MSKDYAGNGDRKATKKGTKANHPMGRLVNVTNGKEIRRVRFAQAYLLVDSGEWQFCPKKYKLEPVVEVSHE
jgi:hypothetical protein